MSRAGTGRRKTHRQKGMSLVEQMISLTLGLLVIGGALGVFAANRETSRSTESLARVQENVRIAFELMSRSLREAGSNPCGILPESIAVQPGLGGAWWSGGANFQYALRGYEKGAGFPANDTVAMAAESDALLIVSATERSTPVFKDKFPTGPLEVQSVTGFASNDILLGCNDGVGTIFKGGPVTAVPVVNNPTAGHIALPTGMAHPMNTVARVNAEAWFVGTNAAGGNSLYRTYFNKEPEEVATDVTDMQISFLVRGANTYVDASTVASDKWQDVVAVLIELKVASASKAGATNAITRKISHTVTLRNRSVTP